MFRSVLRHRLNLLQFLKNSIPKYSKQQRKFLCTSAVPRIIGPSNYGLDIKIPKDKSYVEYILERCEVFADREAIVDGPTGRKYTYRQLSELIIKAGSALRRLGVNEEDVIALHLPNLPEYPVLLYGIQAIGSIVSTVNSVFTPYEIAYQLKDCRAKYIISVDPMIAAAREAAAEVNLSPENVLDLKSLFELIVKDDGSYLPQVFTTNNRDDHVFCLPYSSGTTGRPKGVMLTDTNLIALAISFGNDKFMSRREDIEQECVMGLLPFFAGHSVAVIIGMYFHLGSRVVCMPKFDPEMFLKLIQKEKVTDLPIVPPHALFLAKNPMVDRYDLTSIEKIYSGGAPLAKDVEEQLRRKFPFIRVLRQGFGMTETTADCIINPSETHLIKSGSIGTLLPLMEGKIIDLKTREPVGPNVEGELCARGPIVTKGYLNNPAATAETIDQDGWLHTGDIAYYDEDEYFYITDRIKELIKYKEFQVAPADLEAVLVSNPNIEDAAVLGIPDDEAGEVPRAFVVPKGNISEKDVKNYVASKVSPHKKLRGGVQFVEMIPKNASGKILRRVIRDEINTLK